MGQTDLLLTIGAITLFSILMLSVNTHMVEHSEAIYQQQGEFFALALAQQFIEEAKLRAFDEKTVAGTVSSPSGLTSGLSMGPESGDLDDVDDYDTGATAITVPTTIGNMAVTIRVRYVLETSLQVEMLSQTYYKRMRITVQSGYLANPVSTQHVFAFQKTKL